MSHSCADRHTDNVTTSAPSVHPCSHTSTKMQTPFINGAVIDALVHAMHAKHEATPASVRRYCATMAGRLAPGRRPITCSPLG